MILDDATVRSDSASAAPVAADKAWLGELRSNPLANAPTAQIRPRNGAAPLESEEETLVPDAPAEAEFFSQGPLPEPSGAPVEDGATLRGQLIPPDEAASIWDAATSALPEDGALVEQAISAHQRLVLTGALAVAGLALGAVVAFFV